MEGRQTHRLCFAALILAVLFCASYAGGHLATASSSPLTGEIIWSEDFESGWGDWYTDYGVWQVGKPTSGPITAYEGQQVAATNLSGNYPRNTDSRLISPVITLPNATTNDRLELSFRQWYSYADGDGGYVQVSTWTDTTGWGPWTSLAAAGEKSSSSWSLLLVDLTSFAGKSIRIGFYHTADDWSDVAAGWYIDNVAIWMGSPAFISPETFEFGWGDWYTDFGVWQIGEPTSGPGAAHSGRAVAATNLSGNYPRNTDSRLISPRVILPTVAEDERLELRFWQWYSYADGDGGSVQISVWTDSTGWGSWNSLATAAGENSSSGWSTSSVDLTSYAGQCVCVAFSHAADDWSDVAPGWYIDDVRLWKGVPTFINPETFESGWGDWYADCGVWEVGESSLIPPSPVASGASGSNCAGTALNASYPRNTDSRLISPAVVLPVVTGPQGLNVRFWQRYSYSDGDSGYVQVSVLMETGDWGPWTTVATAAKENTSSDWSPLVVDLKAYSGKCVRIGFYHTADDWSDVAAGWYIDDVQITPAPESWALSEDTGVNGTDKLTNDATPELTFVFPQTVRGVNSDIQILDPTGLAVVPNSISGWGSSKVVVKFTTPLTKDGEYTVTLKRTITDTQGNSIHAGADKVLHFTLDTMPSKATMDALTTDDATPRLTGTIDDPDARIQVFPDPNHDPNGYQVRNNGNGTWILPDDMIDPALATGSYSAAMTTTDKAGNVGTYFGLLSVGTIPGLTLTISSTDGGSVTTPGEGIFPCSSGQVVCLAVQADAGYRFIRWEGTCDVEEVNEPGCRWRVVMSKDGTLKAVFEPICSVVYDFPLDSDPGWARDGQWQFGVPTGTSGDFHGGLDPNSGHTGQNVFGVNLNGSYNLGVGGPYSLVAGPFDLSDCTTAKLTFWRWLNTDIPEYVQSRVELSYDGVDWITNPPKWQHEGREEITDAKWTQVELDLSEAAGLPKVYVRWVYQVMKLRAYAYAGWNIDDIQVIGCR